MTTTPTEGQQEKPLGLSFADLHHHPGGHHSHLKHAKQRLQHFIHPNGTRIHVVDSPQDGELLRRRLKHENSNSTEEEVFEIHISGSPEHLEALRVAQAHHEDRRTQLEEQYKDMYQVFADVHYELDALSHELDRVTSHGVSLEAHFSKFGYDAQIRAYDDEHSGHTSGTTTPKSTTSTSTKSSQAKCEKGVGKPLKLFKVPTLRQYFYKGTLWRSSNAEEVQSFELFVDLLYVGIIQINGDLAGGDPTAFSLFRFALTFSLSWKIWNDMTTIVSWFETDDLVQRFSIIMLLAMLFGYTTNIDEAFSVTYPTLIGFYLAARLFMATYIGIVGFLVPMIRNLMIYHVLLAVVTAALWIGSIYVPYPVTLALVFPAIYIDLAGQVFLVFARYTTFLFGQGFSNWLDRKIQYWPAINIEHRTERMNAFVSLVFGYSVVALLYQSAVNGIDAHYGKAVLGLTQAFCFNWMYFEIDGSNLQMHAIRRHRGTAVAWNFCHLPFIMSFVLGSAGLSKLVLAVDTSNSHLHDLTPPYRLEADKAVPQAIRWFYCGGYAIALFYMSLISMCHVHREFETMRLKKKYRLAGRMIICAIIACLPLAKSLDSLELVGIVTALIAYALFMEHWCATCTREKLFSRGSQCRYLGHCSKKDLNAMIKEGRNLDHDRMASPKHRGSGLIALA